MTADLAALTAAAAKALIAAGKPVRRRRPVRVEHTEDGMTFFYDADGCLLLGLPTEDAEAIQRGAP